VYNQSVFFRPPKGANVQDNRPLGPSSGNEPAHAEVDQFVALTYQELRRLAAHFFSDEHGGQTLQPTALVHEVYLKLASQKEANWQNKGQFFAIAAQSMRRILVDHARSRMSSKRGGTQQRVSLNDVSLFSNERYSELVSVDQSLARLAGIDPRQAKVVELRFYGGLTVEETAKALDISPETVKRDWRLAKAWLYGDMKEKNQAED
jgi:RNA polymerase sigma factor (TIGR02999 family)